MVLNDELSLGAATVVNLSDHFEKLKAEASRLKDSIRASDRGFFTPTEDEQTRHLLVSYWKARNALFELVNSFYSVDRFDPSERGIALAMAYAGALVLVDAARFMRENFHDRPVVRAKLNEPEPNYEIPSGTYDLIQKSLTSPVHAWHLFHATQYVEQHWAQLNEAARRLGGLANVLSVIPHLQHRLDVTLQRFLLARTKARLRSVRTMLGRDLLGRALYGLQKLVSQLLSERYVQPGHHPGLPEGIDAELEAALRPGDILITRKEHALTNYFLPGYWPHAALYLGTSDELQRRGLHEHDNVKPCWTSLVNCDHQRDGRVLESLKDGVRVRSLTCPFTCDAVTVIRPMLATAEITAAIGRGFFHGGKPYDFDFDFSRTDRMVCTEVIYRSYEGIGGVEFELVRRAGRLTLSAEDLLQKALSRDRFEVLASFCPLRSPDLEFGTAAEEHIKATIGRKNPSRNA